MVYFFNANMPSKNTGITEPDRPPYSNQQATQNLWVICAGCICDKKTVRSDHFQWRQKRNEDTLQVCICEKYFWKYFISIFSMAIALEYVQK